MKPSKMWHEARRQERRIRGMLVDYRRRAERRRDFYEKIKADPTQFLQIHGRQCKIHLDPSVAAAADSPAAMMPWQGQSDNLIDRFDVRAHLDIIPPIGKQQENEDTLEERQVNYERYRIVAQNSFLSISEEKFLRQLRLEEQFGYTEVKSKKDKPTGVAIGFNYEDGTGTSQSLPEFPEQCESEDNSDSELDVDLSINVSKIDSVQAHELNRHGCNYGMSSNDFYSFLTNDLEEAENYKLAKEEENEKALFAGRKSRRERRAQREKRIINRTISPPSYAAKASPTYPSIFMSKSPSRSPSPVNAGKITYITSFGGEEDAPSTSKPTYADKVKYGKSKRSSSRDKTVTSRSRSNEKNNYKKRRTRSRSRSKRRSRSRNRYRRSRSRSPSPHKDTTLRSNSTSSSSSCSSRSGVSAANHQQVQGGSGSGGHLPDKVSPPKVVTRYYGRRKSDQSTSSSESNSEDGVNSKMSEEKQSEKGASYGNSGSAIKGSSSANLSIQEKLKRKRQALLAKQYKADKIAEQMKTEREKQEQLSRKEELREMAIKLRKRQREKRHAYDSDDSSSSGSESGSPTSQRSTRNYRSKSKSSTSSEEGKSRPSRKRNSPEKKRDSRERSRERNMESTERSWDVRERNQNSRDRNWGSSERNRDSREPSRGSKETRMVSRERSRGSRERSRGSRERSRGSRERSQECDNRPAARYQYRSRNTERTSERYDRERQNRESFQREQKCDMEERSRDFTRQEAPAPSRRYSPKRYHGPMSRDYSYKDADRRGTNEGDFRERREYGSYQNREGNYNNKQRGARALVDY